MAKPQPLQLPNLSFAEEIQPASLPPLPDVDWAGRGVVSESARLRADYAVAIFEWCRANPYGTADDLLDMIAAVEARVALSRWATP